MATVRVHRLIVPLEFPAGLAPGAGKDAGNRLVVARDGQGRPVLRGSALAGALRHAWSRAAPRQADATERWFGHAAKGEQGVDRPSPLRVADTPLDAGRAQAEPRHHNALDRHTGAVRPEGLFTLEALPPGTTARAVLDLDVDGEQDDAQALAFLREVAGLFESGLALGGHSARGVGRARVRAPLRLHTFDLTTLDGLAAWLDESWRSRDPRPAPQAGTTQEPGTSAFTAIAPQQVLQVDFTLAVPRGQDVCIGEGQANDHDIEPQRVVCADGVTRWRLPGSSLRGVLRAWVTRLAARQGQQVADSARAFQDRGHPATGDELGWGFHDKTQRRAVQAALLAAPDSLPAQVPCPVMRLFGSLYAAGRVYISDALSSDALDDRAAQSRRHVAVDRITGGASEGFLFDHQALLRAEFAVRLSVHAPTSDEARWLAQSLRAIDYGLIRLGSSKSAGRLALQGPVRAAGPHSDAFDGLGSSEVPR